MAQATGEWVNQYRPACPSGGLPMSWARAAAATAAPMSLGCAPAVSKFLQISTPTAVPSERPTELVSRLWVSRVRT